MKELIWTQHSPYTIWHDLGLYLGLYEPTLADIELKCIGNQLECFRECIVAWLLGKDKVREVGGGPSWLSLVSALDTIGEHHIAANIKRKYC